MNNRPRAGEQRWRRFVERVQGGESLPFSEHWNTFKSAYRDWPTEDGPPPAWWPSAATQERSNLSSFASELGLDDYKALHRYTLDHRGEFWERVVARLGILFEKNADMVLDLSDGPEHPRWFAGATLEITRSCFQAPEETSAILYGREEDGTVERLSYHELEERVNQFANGLAEHGLEPGDSVALYMPMTPECVVAYLGTVRSGCRVVSIADSFSSEELASRMEIAAARAVVTVASYERAGRKIALYPKVRAAIEQLEARPFAVVVEVEAGKLEPRDLAWSDFLSERTETPGFLSDPDHVTNVLFSSGTTGTPKAIPWSELTPIKSAMDAHFHQDVHSGDVLCWPTNIGWMMGPWLIYASLLNRATMALYEGAPAGEGFTRFVRDAGATMLGVVPAMVRNWRARESVSPGDWPKLRVFTSTGEASNTEDYLWLMSRADYRVPVIEYLGGTEIGGGHLAGTVLHNASPSTFTTPALGIEVLVLDDEGKVVLEGETGESFLVPPSIGLSQELLNKDHHAVYYEGCPSGPAGEALRRHGDQLARLAKGCFKAQGRADDTMNLGGIKVGSLEIERVVDDHPSVYESAAIAVQPGGEGADRLVLYVVVEQEIVPADLKSELAKRIAEHLNPLFKIHDVVITESVPRTASNKVMRRRLRTDYASRA
ncbi:MAG: AMP-dependent synthetase [Acidobacteria bacterium]|nr:MAG: AMP-dependent synthetase [Acidobacteriota bacterium]